MLIAAGDDVKPAGAFADSLQLLRTVLFERHAIKRVGFAVHPQGLAHASQDVLDTCLREKLSDATRRGMHAYLVTQLFFDTPAIIDWLVQLRIRGINSEIRLSVHGVVASHRLYDFAQRLGISGTELLQEALTVDQHIIGPQTLLVELGKAIANQPQLAPVGLHFCSLGGFHATARLSSALAAGSFAISFETDQQKSLKLI